MRYWLAGLALIAGLCGSNGDATAKVVKFEIVRIEPAFEGRVFGSVGTYDRIIARATVALSPTDPHNTHHRRSRPRARAIRRVWSRRRPKSKS